MEHPWLAGAGERMEGGGDEGDGKRIPSSSYHGIRDRIRKKYVSLIFDLSPDGLRFIESAIEGELTNGDFGYVSHCGSKQIRVATAVCNGLRI